MIGVVLVALSWALLRWQGKSLRELGFDRPQRRIYELGVGCLVAGAFAAMRCLYAAWAGGMSWVVNDSLADGAIAESLRFDVNSVLYEELLFRGYLLYKAIQWWGERRGVAVSAVSFGVYHWFSMELFGNPVAMVMTFVMTGLFGWMCAVAFAKSGSVALPIGLHLGWNLVTNTVFSSGPLGARLLLLDPDRMDTLGGLDRLLIELGVPLSLPILVLCLLLARKSPLGEVSPAPGESR